MYLKDYYRILELEPSASMAEIKKAYRRLAHLHHPDKANNDRYALTQFAEIKEAYEVLSNPSRKEYYLQQRWYNQTTGNKRTTVAITPVSILKQALELDKYVSTLDVHRMDKEGLYTYISELLSDEAIAKLKSFDEPTVKNEIIRLLVHSSHSLTDTHFAQLSSRFKKLSSDPAIAGLVDQNMQRLQRHRRWEKYKPWLLLLIVVVICILIFALSS